MLEQARALQQEQGLKNVSWRQGDVLPLPFPDAQFSIVSARFAFHHFLDPSAVLKEMRRVCRTGGRIVVADSAPNASKADAFNAMELLRDPSHVRAMPLEELRSLFVEPRIETYRLRGELEDLLARSFPGEGDAARIRKIFEESLETDSLDMATVREDGKIYYSYPVAILAANN
jgi:ubiquinone/menaquinone biosynthesis C-methylase UbiE